MKQQVKIFFEPPFLLCVLVLGGAALGMSLIEKHFEMWFVKEPIPLKKSLDFLSEEALEPFKVLRKLKIENKDIIKSLGTEDYIQWVLSDTESSPGDTAQSFMLFITYYEKPDAVPHVPEECYSGGGFSKVSSEPIVFNVAATSDFSNTAVQKEGKINTISIPGQYILFARESETVWQPSAKFPVLYFFNVNGSYVNTRTEARIGLAKNIFSKHSYFCKVEFAFNQTARSPQMKDAAATSEKLLIRLLPLLENEHWPEIYAEKNK